MERYRKYLIIIPTAATMAALAAFSTSAYEVDNSNPTPIVASSSGTAHLSNKAAIKEEIESIDQDQKETVENNFDDTEIDDN